jgi:glycolate oxidase iron-sulfur subunit
MDVQLAAWAAGTKQGHEAQEILRRCVHCGFCTATCPTYQLLGDELDGPRGRIYLMKEMLEGKPVGRQTQTHLDRCLTCRNCETTCPSGVAYGRLIDIGRELVESRVPRPLTQRWLRGALRWGLTSPWFAPAYRLGRALRPLMPSVLQAKLPISAPAGLWPAQRHTARVLLLKGCVQPAMFPAIDAATARVLDAVGYSSQVIARSGCCGAVKHHLADAEGALVDVRRNVDAWWPEVQKGDVAGIVVNASGCGVMVKDYGELLRDDPAYADRAAQIARLAKDPIELLADKREALLKAMARRPGQRVVYHPPCTQQHGMKIRGQVEALLVALGAEVAPIADAHLCCGSAGTYSILQPSLSKALLGQKVESLTAPGPEMILSANVGCIGHLASGTDLPVRHWLEWLDERLV